MTQFQERLQTQGIDVDDRTIQRNLKALLDDKRYGMKRKKEGREYVYWTDKELSQFVRPTDAMNLIMVIDHARPSLSHTFGGNLEELYEHAHAILNKHSHRLYDWTAKVVSNTRFRTLQPGAEEPEAFQTIQELLKFDVLYQPRGLSPPKPCLLTPLELSLQDANIYLALMVDGREPGTPFARPIHRFKSAKTAGVEPVLGPTDCDIRNTSSLKSLIGIEDNQPIHLELPIDEKMFQHLSENSLSTSQTVRLHSLQRWRLNHHDCDSSRRHDTSVVSGVDSPRALKRLAACSRIKTVRNSG